jgi:hypothetical protein
MREAWLHIQMSATLGILLRCENWKLRGRRRVNADCAKFQMAPQMGEISGKFYSLSRKNALPALKNAPPSMIFFPEYMPPELLLAVPNDFPEGVRGKLALTSWRRGGIVGRMLSRLLLLDHQEVLLEVVTNVAIGKRLLRL